ncbi:unnamed protein product [Choristocarpus tenellus]
MAEEWHTVGKRGHSKAKASLGSGSKGTKKSIKHKQPPRHGGGRGNPSSHVGRRGKEAAGSYKYDQRRAARSDDVCPSSENYLIEELEKIKQLRRLIENSALWEKITNRLSTVLPRLGLRLPPGQEDPQTPQFCHSVADGTSDWQQGELQSSKLTEGIGLVSRRDELLTPLAVEMCTCNCSDVQTNATLQNGFDGTEVSGTYAKCIEEVEEGRFSVLPPDCAREELQPHCGLDSSCKGVMRETQVDSSASGIGDRTRQLAIVELVCYGIGNFTENAASRYQLAVALCLRNLLFLQPTVKGQSRAVGDTLCSKGRDKEVALLSQKPDIGISEFKDTFAVSTSSDNYQTRTAKPCKEEVNGNSDVSSIGSNQHCPLVLASSQLQQHTRLKLDVSNPPSQPPQPLQPLVEVPNMLVFDPAMGKGELAVLSRLGCGVIPQNEEGKRCCFGRDKAGPCPTLFFMPHCPMRLYSNLLWANWSSEGFSSFLILGNSLAAYGERIILAEALADESNCVLRASSLLEEETVVPTPGEARRLRDTELLPHAERAFSDLALVFSPPELRVTPEGITALSRQPKEYVEGVDGELITGKARTPT